MAGKYKDTGISRWEYVPGCLPHLFSQGAYVPLKCSMHAMEGLSFAEVFTQIIRKLIFLFLDVSNQLLPIIKVPRQVLVVSSLSV